MEESRDLEMGPEANRDNEAKEKHNASGVGQDSKKLRFNEVGHRNKEDESWVEMKDINRDTKKQYKNAALITRFDEVYEADDENDFLFGNPGGIYEKGVTIEVPDDPPRSEVDKK